MTMSGERASLPGDGNGLLRGSRTRSYGSLVRSSQSPVHQRRIEHKIQPGETLQGLSLKYGVSMEQIKRANGLYTNDSLFLKMSLSIPVLSDLDDPGNGLDSSGQDGEENTKDTQGVHSKQAAVKGCEDAEKRVAALEAACTSRQSNWRPLTRSQSVVSSSTHRAKPLTITKLTTKLRDREDEIFEL
ncbi:hypothetical protein INR49_007384 [Caranx melampygus]|nr:hypothetical protein INR49_007384 [Caranx melampygus]